MMFYQKHDILCDIADIGTLYPTYYYLHNYLGR